MAFPLINYGNLCYNTFSGQAEIILYAPIQMCFKKKKLSSNTVLIILSSFTHISADASSNLSHSSSLEKCLLCSYQ